MGKTKVVDTKALNVLFEIVREETGYTREDIKSMSRLRELYNARMIVSFVAYNYLEYTSSEVGYIINKDHSTVLYTLKKHEDLYLFDKRYQRIFNRVNQRVVEEDLISTATECITQPYIKFIKTLLSEGMTNENKRVAVLLTK